MIQNPPYQGHRVTCILTSITKPNTSLRWTICKSPLVRRRHCNQMRYRYSYFQHNLFGQPNPQTNPRGGAWAPNYPRINLQPQPRDSWPGPAQDFWLWDRVSDTPTLKPPDIDKVPQSLEILDVHEITLSQPYRTRASPFGIYEIIKCHSAPDSQ